MGVEIEETGREGLERYAEVPSRFRVDSVLRVDHVDGWVGGLRTTEVVVDRPYVKDYDAIKGEGPTRWPKRFDVSNWGFFLAIDADQLVGGATVAFRSPGVDMLEGRDDLAVLWDLRVHPDRRGEGIGTRLFQQAADWARARGCGQLKIETQNNNVPACRFYARQGCRLGSIVQQAYDEPELAHEAMLLWYLDL